MALADIIRAVMPHRIRITVGRWSIDQASRSWTTLAWYLTILHGRRPKNMGIANGYCYYDFGDRRILAPQNAAGIFMETFVGEAYERVWRPEEGDTVLDIGAYVGMFTIKASKAVGPTGRVIAIEPSPENYALLKRNCKGLGNVTLIRKAIWSSNGVERLYYSKSPAANSLVTSWKDYVEVETTTLDNLMRELGLDNVDFIKLDAEGAELDVLKGAGETMSKGTRIVIAAYHTAPNGEAEIEQVAELLGKAGYTATQRRGLRSYLHAERIMEGE